MVDDLPACLQPAYGTIAGRILKARAPSLGLNHDQALDDDLELEEDLFSRTDQLLAAHQEMAGWTCRPRSTWPASLAMVEEQLAALTERQAAVEARLQQIRAAIIRRYQEGGGVRPATSPPDSGPGPGLRPRQ